MYFSRTIIITTIYIFILVQTLLIKYREEKAYINHITQSQSIPIWFDESLQSLLTSKVKESVSEADYNNILVYFVFYLNFKDLNTPNKIRGDPSWSFLEKMMNKIKFPEDYKPDIIIGIKSGGALIANYIAKKLGVKEIDYIKIKKYKAGDIAQIIKCGLSTKYGDKATIISEYPQKCLFHKKVLIVDDSVGFGSTLKKAREFIYTLGAKDVRTATITCLKDFSLVDYSTECKYMMIWPWGIDC